jgi:hypothetical protein
MKNVSSTSNASRCYLIQFASMDDAVAGPNEHQCTKMEVSSVWVRFKFKFDDCVFRTECCTRLFIQPTDRSQPSTTYIRLRGSTTKESTVITFLCPVSGNASLEENSDYFLSVPRLENFPPMLQTLKDLPSNIIYNPRFLLRSRAPSF